MTRRARRRGAAAAQDFDSRAATLELLADEAAMTRVRQANAHVAIGRVTIAAEMAELMKRRQRQP